MKKTTIKKMFALILAGLLILSGVSCGSKPPSAKPTQAGGTPAPTTAATPEPTDEPAETDSEYSYSGAFNAANMVISLFSGKIQSLVAGDEEEGDNANAATNGIDVNQVSMVFMDPDIAYTGTLNEADDEAAATARLSGLGLENLVFKKNAPHDYTLTFETKSVLDDSKQTIQMDCKYDPATASMQYVCSTTSGGKTTKTFFEFVPLSDGVYALQNAHERALITTDGEDVSQFVYSTTRGSSNPFITPEKAIVYSTATDSIFKKTSGLDEKWVSGNRDTLESIYTYDGAKLTVEQCTSNTAGTKWTWQKPVVITPQA